MAVRSTHGTLTGGAATTVTLTQRWTALKITNRSAVDFIYARVDGIVPVAAADETDVIPPSTSLVLYLPANLAYDPGQPRAIAPTTSVVQIISAGAAPYSVTAAG